VRGRVEVIRADITTLDVDVVVNAANASLMGGSGVDGAIHAAGGPAILEACREVVARQGRLATGDAVATTAGDLPARWVVHTVGPVFTRDPAGAPALLASCYRRALEEAAALGASSIAFPSISTGVYGYPVADAAQVAMGVLVPHARSGAAPARVVMCCFSDGDRRVYASARDAVAAGPSRRGTSATSSAGTSGMPWQTGHA
jgi:O-acetyl-ADP-ribose deacetylase